MARSRSLCSALGVPTTMVSATIAGIPSMWAPSLGCGSVFASLEEVLYGDQLDLQDITLLHDDAGLGDIAGDGGVGGEDLIGRHRSGERNSCSASCQNPDHLFVHPIRPQSRGREVPKPRIETNQKAHMMELRTLGDLLSLVDFGSLSLQQLVSLLAQAQDGDTGNSSLGDLSKDPQGDVGGIVVLGAGTGVSDGVVFFFSRRKLANVSKYFAFT